METTTLLLSGLTCPAFQKLIQKRILRIDGVQGVNFELTAQPVIKSDRKITSGEVVEVLKDTKYSIEESS